MKIFLGKLLVICGMFAALVVVAMLAGLDKANADYRDGVGSGKFVESTVTSATPNEQGSGVHTPIVASVPSVMAAVTTSYFTSSTSAIAFDTSGLISTAFDLVEVRTHFSASSSTQTLVLSIDSGAGTEFDVVLFSTTITGTSEIFRPSRPVPVRSADSVKVVYPNANSDTVGSEIIVIEP